jgi:UDP-glucose:glycoprotein glucosyltransferase
MQKPPSPRKSSTVRFANISSNQPLTACFLAIGHQAIQLIAESTNPLQTLTTLSQNFPKYATSLSRRVQVSSSIEEELAKKARKIQAGANYFWFNGQAVAPRDVHVFSLMNLLKKEKSLMKHTVGLGLERSKALEVMTHSDVTKAQKDGLVTDGLLDASDRPEDSEVIVWFNDIESDFK